MNDLWESRVMLCGFSAVVAWNFFFWFNLSDGFDSGDFYSFFLGFTVLFLPQIFVYSLYVNYLNWKKDFWEVK